MKFGLNDTTIDKIQKVFSKYPEIEQVIIYGSRANGLYRNGSDIDITLLGNNISDEIMSKIFWEIDELNTPYLFDISIFTSLKLPSLIHHIEKVGQVFYDKKLVEST